MIRKVRRQQMIQMLRIPHASRRTVSANEPSFSRSVPQTIEFESKQVFEPAVHFFPRIEVAPANDEMGVPFIESSALKLPSFLNANLVREKEHLPLRFRVEYRCILLCIFIVLVCESGIGWLITFTLFRKSARMIGTPTSVGVDGEMVVCHALIVANPSTDWRPWLLFPTICLSNRLTRAGSCRW